MVTDAQIGIALEAFDQKAGYSKIEKMRAALEAAMSAAEPHPAPSVAVKDLEWEAIGTRMFVATTPVGVNYQLQEFSSWTNNPFQLVVREADDGNTKVSFYLTLDEAKVAAQADYEARILSALSAQVQDESEVIDCLLAGKPFVFDPATNFCHADDGGAPEHGIKYVPAAQEQDVVEAPPVDIRHRFEPNSKYPWFCAVCGYAPHEPLKHLPAAPAKQEA